MASFEALYIRTFILRSNWQKKPYRAGKKSVNDQKKSVDKEKIDRGSRQRINILLEEEGHKNFNWETVF